MEEDSSDKGDLYVLVKQAKVLNATQLDAFVTWYVVTCYFLYLCINV